MGTAALACTATPAHSADFVFNASIDALDAQPGDGVCADNAGRCTLRAAPMEANLLAGAGTIDLRG